MIYKNNLLVIRILFENLTKKPIFGVFRPQAYMQETGKYCSNLRFNVLNREIKKGEKVVFETILEAPVGFGEHLREGAMLIIKEGLDEAGKAIVLEILGYYNEAKQ